MATESAGESKPSVTLPPSLSEWLENRAETLGIERETLLVELLETHRVAVDEGDLASLFEDTEDRIDGVDRRADEALSRIDEIEAKLSNNVEDLRGRVLQLRDGVEGRAKKDHTHGEFEALSERIEGLSEELDGIDESDGTNTEAEAVTEGLETMEKRLDRLARVVLAEKRRRKADADATELEELRRIANRRGLAVADCGGCGESIRIGLLSEATCPHCALGFDGFEQSESIFERFKTPKLAARVEGRSNER